ncbi:MULTISPECIES: sensor histidine kinase [unclassified Clostridioides]|uniref:sensor histidine kinase n=1 Tax=unclassified Clostridioides TaxID=2635829 RepID=UPI001D12B3C2|nr:HAMP domain-containing histidine kinase [Clostridioides sp. ES-S-0049-03]MCC0674750.1 HAMP domain-containing histidine kinase [Clostridioides sp. ES-W-0018-02]MCC0710435.1 HAMP domain-containing histidine kinase [Clostridioides sp. ES-W-0017-02]
MKWKITRNFMLTIVFIVISVVIINIASILYVISTNNFFNVVGSKNSPEEFARSFEKELYEKNGEFKLSKVGIDKLKKSHFWVQVLNDSGEELYGVNVPTNTPKKYTPFQMVNNYKYIETEYTNFVLEKYLGNKHLNIIIGMPSRDVSRIILTYSQDNAKAILNKIITLTLVIDGMVALSIGYLFSRKLTKPISNVIWSIETMANGNYSLYLKNRGIYEEVFENINMLADTLRVNEAERKENEEMREEWLANITHDINTPLASIQGYAEIINDKDYEFVEEELREYTEIIYNKSKYIKNLVDDLNLSTRLKNNSLVLNKKKINLVSLVRNIIIDILNDNRYKNRNIEFVSYEDLIEVYVDSILFRRAITNLIFNSIVHNKEETLIKIEIVKKDTIEIIIKDSGVGISKNDLKHIFEKYYRGTNTGELHKGSGLGMAISKEIIEIHKGSIYVNSEIGIGTEVVIKINQK